MDPRFRKFLHVWIGLEFFLWSSEWFIDYDFSKIIRRTGVHGGHDVIFHNAMFGFCHAVTFGCVVMSPHN